MNKGCHSRPHPRNSGLLGLEGELHTTPSTALAEQITLLIEALDFMPDQALPRLRIAAWTLRDRLTANQQQREAAA